MTFVTMSLRRLLSFVIMLPVLFGCARYAPVSEHSILADIEAHSTATHYSPQTRDLITTLGLTRSELSNPLELEGTSALKSESEIIKDLFFSELYLASAQSASSEGSRIERLVRSAHFAYQALLRGLCSPENFAVCSALKRTYSLSVSQYVQATGAHAPSTEIGGSRYIIDEVEDGDQLDLSEWEVQTTQPVQAVDETEVIGAPGVGCLRIRQETDRASIPRCSPIAFLLTFESPSDAEHVRVHLAAYETYPTNTLLVRDQELALPSPIASAWHTIVNEKLNAVGGVVCLGEPDPFLPFAILAVGSDGSQQSWVQVATSLSRDTEIFEHYNICAVTPTGSDVQSATDILTSLGGLSLSPSRTAVVLIGEGQTGAEFTRDLKAAARSLRLTEQRANNHREISVAGSLSIPPLTHGDSGFGDTDTHSNTASPVLRRTIGDIRRFLLRLTDKDDGPLAGKLRSAPPKDNQLKFSPVM